MLTEEQKNTIANTPSFRVNIKIAGCGMVSILGEPDKGFIEVALLKGDGHINHEPPFPHDGFGVATIFRENANDELEKILLGLA